MDTYIICVQSSKSNPSINIFKVYFVFMLFKICLQVCFYFNIIYLDVEIVTRMDYVKIVLLCQLIVSEECFLFFNRWLYFHGGTCF